MGRSGPTGGPIDNRPQVDNLPHMSHALKVTRAKDCIITKALTPPTERRGNRYESPTIRTWFYMHWFDMENDASEAGVDSRAGWDCGSL